jgi:hypothetical protein
MSHRQARPIARKDLAVSGERVFQEAQLFPQARFASPFSGSMSDIASCLPNDFAGVRRWRSCYLFTSKSWSCETRGEGWQCS